MIVKNCGSTVVYELLGYLAGIFFSFVYLYSSGAADDGSDVQVLQPRVTSVRAQNEGCLLHVSLKIELGGEDLKAEIQQK